MNIKESVVCIGIAVSTIMAIIVCCFWIVSYKDKQDADYRSHLYCDNDLVLTQTITGYGPKGAVYTSGYICAIPAKRK